MKKEVKYGLTISAFTFCTPWMHWLAYQNLLLAWPDMDHGWAHAVGIGMPLIAAGLAGMIIFI